VILGARGSCRVGGLVGGVAIDITIDSNTEGSLRFLGRVILIGIEGIV
jgi:hypothetical protein